MSNSRFSLPEDWVVEDRRRSSGKSSGVVDRYYYEPQTGQKFRSLRSVEKYIEESQEKTPALKMPGFDKDEPPKKKRAMLSQSTTGITSAFDPPDNWVVERRVRTSGASAGRVDKYYYDLETGHNFRSLSSVKRYVAKSIEEIPTLERLGFDKKVLNHKLKITNKSSSLNLPDGWLVEEHARNTGVSAGKIDRYYIEPGTGRKFRSLVSAERHINEMGGSRPITKDSKPDNGIVLRRSNLEASAYRSSRFQLPDGWTVKEVPSNNYANRIDKYYYEPETGRQFRSLLSVKRYLNEEDDYTPTLKAHSQKSKTRTKKISDLMVKATPFNSTERPEKIKWVKSGGDDDTWSPFVNESMVPYFVKEEWDNKFNSIVDLSQFYA